MRWSVSLKIFLIFMLFWSLTDTLESDESSTHVPRKENLDNSEDDNIPSNTTNFLHVDQPLNETYPELATNYTDFEQANVTLGSNDTNGELHDILDAKEFDSAINLQVNETMSTFEDADSTSHGSSIDNKIPFPTEGFEPVLKEVKSEYDILIANTSSDNDIYYSRSINGSMKMSGSTVSWLEAFMYQHRNSYWIIFNLIFMIMWILLGLFSLYRLFGLPLCSSLLSRTLYLVIHLMIFTASTFSVVHLLHLCFGSHEGLPPFLTLLLTHTPVPCLASCSILVGYCIFCTSRVPIFGSFLPSFLNLSFFVSSLITASLLGDIIVGITQSSIVLIIFRSFINGLCIGAFFVFLCRYKKILQVARILRREFSGELKSLVIPINMPNKEFSLEVKNKLKDILVIWSILILVSCIAGSIMCLCSLFLSLFFTISFVPLWLFWVLHSFLFLSQITVIVSLTLSAALTLVNTTSQNILVKYFVLAFPTDNNRCGSFIKHGNFIYQRVSFSNMPPTCSNNANDELSSIKNNQVIIELPCPDQRPKVNLRRAVTFNCGPQERHIPYYSKNKLNPILSENCIPCYNLESCHCNFKELNTPYCSNCMPHHRSSRCYESEEKESPYAYCGKYPRKNYYGRGKSTSLRNLANGIPQTGVQAALQSVKLNSIPLTEMPLPRPTRSPNSSKSEHQHAMHSSNDKDCVKEIILENQQLFNPLLRKQSMREQASPRPPRGPMHQHNPTSPLRNRKRPEDNTVITVTPEKNSYYPKRFESSSPPSPLKDSPPPSKCVLNSNNVNTVENKIIKDSPPPSKCVLNSNNVNTVENKINVMEKNPLTDKSRKCDEKILVEAITIDNFSEQTDPKMESDESSTQYTESTLDSTINANHMVVEHPKLAISNTDYDSFTLPSPKRQSLKRNHSSAGDFMSNNQTKSNDPDQYSNLSLSNTKLKYPWYGTWSGRRSKKRPNVHENSDGGLNSGLRRLSGSKGSLSSLYGKLKPKRTRSMVHPPEHIALDKQAPGEEDTPAHMEGEEDKEEEILPSISEDIDLASEIFKSSRLLSDFYALEESEVEDAILEKFDDPQPPTQDCDSSKADQNATQIGCTNLNDFSFQSNVKEVT